MAERIDLDDEANVEIFYLAHRHEAVEDRLPVLVAGEIVVGDEKGAQALRIVRPHDQFDVVGRAAARFAALHVDDGAERALIRAAAAGIEAGGAAGGALRAFDRHQRDRRALDPRQIGHEIVKRLERARRAVTQHLVEMALRLAREQRHAHGPGAVEIGVNAAEHRQHAGNVEAADADLDAARAQRARQIERARELVRLHAGQHDHAGPGRLDHRRQTRGPDAGIGFVKGVNLDTDVVAEHCAFGAVLGQTIERGQ